MSSFDRRQDHHSEPDPFLGLLYGAAVFLMLLPVAPGVVLGLLLGRLLKGRDGIYLAMATLGAVACGLILSFLLHPMSAVNSFIDEMVYQTRHSFQWMRLLRAVLPLWAMSLLLAPVIGLVWGVLQPKNVEGRALERAKEGERRLKRASVKARRKVKKTIPYGVAGRAIIGASAGGDLGWRDRHLFYLPTRELGQHGVVIGSSGSGKTETLLRIAVCAAVELGWQVIFVDGKGDKQTAERFVAAMKLAGKRVKYFPEDQEKYNAWLGDQDALLNRLLAIEDFSDSAYYRAVAENILLLALEAGKELPRDSRGFLRRLRIDYLISYYKDVLGAPEQTAYLEGLSRKDLGGVYSRYRATFAKLKGKLDGVWSFDDVDAGYLLLDGLALRELASGVGRLLLEDFAHYAGMRKPLERRVLFIFDEVGAVDVDVTNLFERVRSKNVSIFVSGQSYAGLGYRGLETRANRIVSAATTVILHACSDPDELIKRGGKLKRPEAGYGFEEGERSTGRGTLHVREELRVSSDAVRQLEVGEAYVIAHGRAERVWIAQIVAQRARMRSGQQREDFHKEPTEELPGVELKQESNSGPELQQVDQASQGQEEPERDPDMIE